MQRLRAYYVELLLTGALLAAVAFFGYLGYGLLRPEIINEPFSGEKALANVEKQLAFGPRVTGTASSISTGDWLVEQLRLMGWDVVIQPFAVQESLSGRNIVAVRSHSKPGSPVALLATHYDTRLMADQEPDPANRQLPTPGANAGASGAAVLLELARTLDVEATGHTICLGFFDAEENGGLPGWEPQLGSALFVRSLPASVPRCAAPRFVVDLDMVGAPEQSFMPDANGDAALQDALWQVAASLDFGNWFPDTPQPHPPGSRTAFAAQGIPTVTLSALDYPQRFTLADTLEQLSAESLQRVGMVLETWLETRP